MTRKDGRIEPGQRLGRSISARAWNRAQDAADIVLGERPAFVAEAENALPKCLVMPCLVATTVSGVMPGHAVEIISADGRFPFLNKESPDTFSPSVSRLAGNVVRPRAFNATTSTVGDFNAFRNAYQVPIGVIVGGSTMPTPGSPQTVDLCIAGACVARVKHRFGFFTTGSWFVQPPFLRTSADTTANLSGVLELTDTGLHRAVFVGFGSQVASYTSPTNPEIQTNITWAVVVL